MAGARSWGRQQLVFRKVIRRAREAGIPFAAGGFHGLAVYTGQKRKSKDLDLYILPADRERMIDVLSACGLTDFYVHRPYDRGWIYRAHEDRVIVDVIWSMANYRAEVDRLWLERGAEFDFAGERMRALPAEEMLWTRLYVIQHDRCDWPDIMNLLASVGAKLDWDRLFERVAGDRPLLAAALGMFGWLDPARAARIPEDVWSRLGLRLPGEPPAPGERPHPSLLDLRQWYVGEGGRSPR